MEQPATGFQVASVHSIDVAAMLSPHGARISQNHEQHDQEHITNICAGTSLSARFPPPVFSPRPLHRSEIRTSGGCGGDWVPRPAGRSSSKARRPDLVRRGQRRRVLPPRLHSPSITVIPGRRPGDPCEPATRTEKWVRGSSPRMTTGRVARCHIPLRVEPAHAGIHHEIPPPQRAEASHDGPRPSPGEAVDQATSPQPPAVPANAGIGSPRPPAPPRSLVAEPVARSSPAHRPPPPPRRGRQAELVSVSELAQLGGGAPSARAFKCAALSPGLSR